MSWQYINILRLPSWAFRFWSFFIISIVKSNWFDARLNLEFCLADFRTNTAQLVNVILIRIIGQCAKTCSNLFYFLFTIKRCVTITNSKRKVLVYLKNCSLKKKLLLGLLISLVVNSYSYFQFSKWEDKAVYAVGFSVIDSLSQVRKKHLLYNNSIRKLLALIFIFASISKFFLSQ